MTGQRRIIARVLSEAEDHPDVEEVYRRATEQDPRISIATIYRTVRLFEEANILDRHDFGDGRARYEEATDEHHDHLIDIQTGQVIEFTNDEIEALQDKNRRIPWLQAGRSPPGTVRRAPGFQGRRRRKLTIPRPHPGLGRLDTARRGATFFFNGPHDSRGSDLGVTITLLGYLPGNLPGRADRLSGRPRSRR